MKISETAFEVARLVEQIKPLLAGRGPDVQSAVLGDLIAMWLAGHPDFVRQEVLDTMTRLVWQLVPVNEQMLFGMRGHPQNNGGKEKGHAH